MNLYGNAAEVLPPALLAEVQKHWRGLLWVPVPQKTEHTAHVSKVIQSGLSAQDVALILGISLPRVYQLASKLGAANPDARRKRHV